MTIKDTIIKQLPHVITVTNFNFLSDRYEGKVRDVYQGKGCRYLVTTDRLSCFDRVVTCVPFKGQVLNQLALYWFDKTKHITDNHLIDSPDPNVMAVKDVKILPVEVVIRGYLAGSAWRDYKEGRPVSGVTLPAGLKAHDKLPEAIVTPSTKAAKGSHDQPIGELEIVSSGLVSKTIWDEVRSIALSLFAFGQGLAKQHGLILADTKYEFGIYQGDILLADEIHTLDSSRYWVAESYEEKLKKGESPVMLDKEPTRQWLLDQGFSGDGSIPHFTDEHIALISQHYIQAFEWISGQKFNPITGDAIKRMSNNLLEFEAGRGQQ